MQHDRGLLQNERPPNSDPRSEASGPDSYCLIDSRQDYIRPPDLHGKRVRHDGTPVREMHFVAEGGTTGYSRVLQWSHGAGDRCFAGEWEFPTLYSNNGQLLVCVASRT